MKPRRKMAERPNPQSGHGESSLPDVTVDNDHADEETMFPWVVKEEALDRPWSRNVWDSGIRPEAAISLFFDDLNNAIREANHQAGLHDGIAWVYRDKSIGRYLVVWETREAQKLDRLPDLYDLEYEAAPLDAYQGSRTDLGYVQQTEQLPRMLAEATRKRAVQEPSEYLVDPDPDVNAEPDWETPWDHVVLEEIPLGGTSMEFVPRESHKCARCQKPIFFHAPLWVTASFTESDPFKCMGGYHEPDLSKDSGLFDGDKAYQDGYSFGFEDAAEGRPYRPDSYAQRHGEDSIEFVKGYARGYDAGTGYIETKRAKKVAYKGIAIYPDKRVEDVEISSPRDIIKGIFAAVDLADGSAMWVDDEFLYKYPDSEFNSIATDVAGLGGRYDLLLGGVKGPVVITGGPDSEGYTQDVPESARRWVNRVKREAHKTAEYAPENKEGEDYPGVGEDGGPETETEVKAESEDDRPTLAEEVGVDTDEDESGADDEDDEA